MFNKQLNNIKMKTFKVNFYKNNDWNCTDLISSKTFECKSIATASKNLSIFFPNEFGYYKLFDNDKCRESGTKESYFKYQKERYKK